jgi:predicted methyltransferase MtxX (methanogen marker protein 4)
MSEEEALEVTEDEQEATPVVSAFRAISSQDELDRVISERLKRERAKFADYKDLQSKAIEYDKIVESTRSETEKLSSKAAEAEARAAALAAKVRSKALKAEVVSMSNRLGIIDADVALALLGSVEFDEDDEPIGIEERLKDLVKSKPFLKAPRFESSVDGGSRNPSPDLSTVDMETYMAQRKRKP